MINFAVAGRIGARVELLGSLSQNSKEPAFAQIAHVLNSMEDLKSVEILSDLRDEIIGIEVCKRGFPESLETKLINEPIFDSLSTGMLTEIPENTSMNLVSKRPLRLLEVTKLADCFGLVTAHKILHGHKAWVIFEFFNPARMQRQREDSLKSLGLLLATSGFNLLTRMCCLEPDCNSFGLIARTGAPNDSIQVNQPTKLTNLEFTMLNAFKHLDHFERRILELMAEGKSNSEIARTLFVSASSIRNASSKIYNKIGARNRQDAVVMHTRHQQLHTFVAQ